MWIKCKDRLPACSERVLLRDGNAIYSAVFVNAIGYNNYPNQADPLGLRLRWNKEVQRLFLPDTDDRNIVWAETVEEWMPIPVGML